MDIIQYTDELSRKGRIISSQGSNGSHVNLLYSDFRNFDIYLKKRITNKDLLTFSNIKSVKKMREFITKLRKRWHKESIKAENFSQIFSFRGIKRK